MSTKLFSLEYPGLDWLTITTDVLTGIVIARVKLVHSQPMALDDVYEDCFEMKYEDIGVNGTALLAEAYRRRAKLMVVAKVAKEMQ